MWIFLMCSCQYYERQMKTQEQTSKNSEMHTRQYILNPDRLRCILLSNSQQQKAD